MSLRCDDFLKMTCWHSTSVNSTLRRHVVEKSRPSQSTSSLRSSLEDIVHPRWRRSLTLTGKVSPIVLYIMTRFTTTNQWFYIQSNYNLTDIGTRRCASIKYVGANSICMNGHMWMQLDYSECPILKPEIKLKDIKIDVESHG